MFYFLHTQRPWEYDGPTFVDLKDDPPKTNAGHNVCPCVLTKSRIFVLDYSEGKLGRHGLLCPIELFHLHGFHLNAYGINPQVERFPRKRKVSHDGDGMCRFTLGELREMVGDMFASTSLAVALFVAFSFGNATEHVDGDS